MKKKVLLSMALLTAAVVAGSTPLTTYGAQASMIGSSNNNCYKVYIGQNSNCLSEKLKGLCVVIGSNGNFCTTEVVKPEINVPEAPTPDTGVQKPDVQEPEAPTPDTGVQKPETQKPETQKPGTDAGDTETLSYVEQVAKLVNEERAKAGLSALTLNTDITAAANVRAKEIAQSFSHTRPNGSSFSSVLREQGISFRGAGENIAWGQKTPEQVMNGWMNSEGHRANILNKNFTEIGVGYYQDANGVNHWVQLFTY